MLRRLIDPVADLWRLGIFDRADLDVARTLAQGRLRLELRLGEEHQVLQVLWAWGWLLIDGFRGVSPWLRRLLIPLVHDDHC